MSVFALSYEADFRNQMLNAIKDFSASSQNGLFINSCFAHCQSETQDTWFANDSPVIGNKARPYLITSSFLTTDSMDFLIRHIIWNL